MSATPQNPDPDTPHILQTPSGKVSDVKRHLRDQLEKSNGMHFKSDAAKFLKIFFPFAEERTTRIFDALKRQELYTDAGGGRWAGLPIEEEELTKKVADSSSGNKRKRGKLEEQLYEPFLKVLCAISKEASEGGNDPDCLNGQWINTSNRVPVSANMYSQPFLKPDISFVSQMEAAEVRTKWPVVSEHHTEEAESDDARGPQRGTNGVRESAIKEAESRLWLQTFTVIEIKVKESGAPLLYQLATYVKQIFMEQLDRHFVLAFTLTLTDLSAHLFDRSGIISATPINIHQDPKCFIQIISSLSTRSATALGWDPTVRVWNQGEVVPSYKAQMGDYTCCHDVPWVIEGFNSPISGVDDVRVGAPPNPQYVAIRSSTLRNAKRLWGRGTCVLEVVSLEDWKAKKEQPEVLVMKQSWQRLPGLDEANNTISLANSSMQSDALQETESPHQESRSFRKTLESVPFEAFVINKAGLGDRLASYGFVRAGEQNDKVDTSNYIRQGIKPGITQESEQVPKKKAGSKHASRSGSRLGPEEPLEHSVTSRESGPRDVQPKRDGFANRTLTRLFMKLRGTPLKEFRSKKELLTGILGALRQHERCYKNGIIHRDVSISNIMLDGGEGHLIDFDHCKITGRLIPSELSSSPAPDPFQEKQSWLQTFEEHVVDTVMNSHGHLATYVLNLLKHFVYPELFPPSRPISATDLRWGEPYDIPNFENRRAAPGFVTGTPPFVSCHLGTKVGTEVHTAVHDVESFFWVLLYVLIKYSEPGILLEDAETRDIIDKLYCGDTSQPHRRDIIHVQDELAKVLGRLSNHFKDLKELLETWRAFLHLAFSSPKSIYFKYPHHVVIKLIQNAIDKDTDGDTATDVDARRDENIAAALRSWKTVYAISHHNGQAQGAQTPHAASTLEETTSSTPLLSPEHVSGSTLHSQSASQLTSHPRKKTRN